MSNVICKSDSVDPRAAVLAWDNEKASYNYTSLQCTGVCGHYTQVWKKITIKAVTCIAVCVIDRCLDVSIKSNLCDRKELFHSRLFGQTLNSLDVPLTLVRHSRDYPLVLMQGLSWFAIMVKGKSMIFYSNTLLDIIAVTRNSTSSLHTPGPSSGNYNGQQPYMTGTPCTSCPRGYSCTNDLCVSDGDDSGSGTSSSTGQGQVTNRHRILISYCISGGIR